MKVYQIVIADDHALFRHGLKGLLDGASDLQVIGEAGDGFELIRLLKSSKNSPNLIILDISMPNLRGIEAIQEIKTLHPTTKIMIVTMHSDKEYLFEALAAGIDGYFLKKDAGDELLSAIDKIRKGKVYISPQLSFSLEDGWNQMRQVMKKSVVTPREKEVLKMIAEGRANKEIADLMFISVHTVERHRANIMKKLDLKNTADLVKYAIQKGYV